MLKGNDWPAFWNSFKRLTLFYVCCSSKGSMDYARAMVMFEHIVRYWLRLQLPVAEMLATNHTIFSEESGEVALSVLAHSQPPNVKSDLNQTRKYWFLTRARYNALRSGQDVPRAKKHRIVGNYLSSITSCHPLSQQSMSKCAFLSIIFLCQK